MAGYKNFQVDRKKYTNDNMHTSLQKINPSKTDENLTKSERLMNGVAVWTAYYRARPDIFVEDYLGITLKPFQSVILYAMIHYNYTMFIASRGIGKTFITALYAIVRCILYPKTKIVVASGTKGQSMKVIEKIYELKTMSTTGMLDREIRIIRDAMNTDRPNVDFMNDSWIKVVAATENARSGRANVLVLDEFRLIDKSIYQNTLRRFLAVSRQPKFLEKEPYKTDRKKYEERNQEIFLSSCWYKHNWSYERFVVFLKAMLSGRGYFVCGLPYEFAIKEGLNNKEQLIDELREEDIDEIGFSMEMRALFFGESEKAYFKIAEMEKIKVIKKAMYPKPYYSNGLINNKQSFKYIKKKLDEIRIVTADIAMIKGNKNDASIYSIMIATPKYKGIKGKDRFVGYDRKVVYMESYMGKHAQIQAMRIRELFDDFDCDYIVLDRAGGGIGVYDALSSKLYNEVRDIEYTPFITMNDDRLDTHTIHPESEKKIFTINATVEINNDVAVNLKNCIASKKILLLKDRSEGEDYLSSFKEFHTMSAENRAELLAPYVQTQALINEMVLLENKRRDRVALEEPSNGRKDRYSSVAYGNYFITTLEKEKLNKIRKVIDWQKMLLT